MAVVRTREDAHLLADLGAMEHVLKALQLEHQHIWRPVYCEPLQRTHHLCLQWFYDFRGRPDWTFNKLPAILLIFSGRVFEGRFSCVEPAEFLAESAKSWLEKDFPGFSKILQDKAHKMCS